MTRPTVDVVVPFRGERDDLEELRARLSQLELGDGDSLVIVDNTPGRTQLPPAEGTVRVLCASELGTPAYARNHGARAGDGEWLVFIDADTEPVADLLDRYFHPPPGERTALLAGGVRDEPVAPDGPPAARYLYISRGMSQDHTFRLGTWAFAQTANAACRRSAFEAVGGFRAEIRAGEDADLTYRLRAAGWEVERREQAFAVHRNRRTVRALLAQRAAHGSAAGWLDSEHPGAAPPRRRPGLVWWAVRTSARRLVSAARTRDRDAALWAALEPLEQLALEFGRSASNERRLPPSPAPERSAAPARAGGSESPPASDHVCAVVHADGDGEVQAALERQTRPPDSVEPARAGITPAAEWIWFVDGGAIPDPTALEQLIQASATADGLPDPVLLASKVVLPDGSLDPLSLPVAQVKDPDFAIAAFEHRMLSLRVARRGSVLVHRVGIATIASRWPQLSIFDDDMEWTARLLKERPGVLVPTSVVVRTRPPTPPPAGELRRRVRLLLGDAIELGDKPWFGFRFAEELVADLRRRMRR